MRLHRFIGAFDLSKKEVKITDPENIKQIKGVLRMEIGSSLILSDGHGNEAEVSIFAMEKSEILCMVEKMLPTIEPQRKVHLYLAILKKENFELAVQKAVECGVSNIIPIITERTVKTGLNIERLEKIIKEASEQSGRSVVPTLSPILNFTDAVENGRDQEEKIIFHPKENSENSYQPKTKANTVSIFVGPEGGYTEKEIKLAVDMGYTVASLGQFILRGETAATVSTYRAVNAI